MGWPGWHVPPLGLWNFHQPVKELKSTGKIFIKCPYDFASEVRYTVNMNWLKKCATPVILPQIRLWEYTPIPLAMVKWDKSCLIVEQQGVDIFSCQWDRVTGWRVAPRQCLLYSPRLLVLLSLCGGPAHLISHINLPSFSQDEEPCSLNLSRSDQPTHQMGLRGSVSS